MATPPGPARKAWGWLRALGAAASSGRLMACPAPRSGGGPTPAGPWHFFGGGSPRALILRSFLPLTIGSVLSMAWVFTRVDLQHIGLSDVILLLGILSCTVLLAAGLSARIGADIEAAESRIRESEDMFRRIVELSPFGQVLSGCDGRLTEINDAFAGMLGYSKEELVKMSLIDITHPDDAAKTKEWARALLVGKHEAYRLAKRFIRKDGGVLWVDMATMLLRDEDGVPKHMNTTVVDVSEIKRATETVFASEVRYRRLFEAARDGILILDAQTGDIIDVNPFLIELLGWSREQFFGKKIWELGTFADSIVNKDKFAELQTKGYVRYDDLPLQAIDGRKVQVELVSNVYLVSGREVIQCNIRDNTLRHRQADALRQSELLIQSLVDHLPQCIFVKNRDSVYIFCNSNYERDLGVGPGQALGKDDFAFFSRELAEGYQADDRAVMAEGRSKDIDERYEVAGKERSIHAIKVPFRDAKGDIVGVLGAFEDITERKRAEAELHRLKGAIEQAGESILITDIEGTIIFVNPAFETSTGYSREEAVGHNSRILKSGKHDAAVYRELWKTISSGRVWAGRLVNKRKDGALRDEDITISPVRDSGGRISNYVAVKRDVTQFVRLENELRQAQKMESVGRLAGGIAHDFNNVLTAINGYTGFALAGLAEGDQRLEDLKEVLSAAERASRLTAQLLAFSRKQILKPEVLDLNAAVGAILSMLKRLIGENIKLETRLAAFPCLVKVDAGQIEQVVLNLAVNARDAMPEGGTLTFETAIAAASEDAASGDPDMPCGPRVCLSACDTGCGMSDEIKAHLFEPFFTTKQMGKGTGLGLSTVFGIIKQSGGGIKVESVPDHGTTFRIYLPRVDAQIKDKDMVKDLVARGNETVLLVEDEASLRRLETRALTANGYVVLAAADGRRALEALERRGRPVDLLITDVVMPGMNGRELARTISSKNMAGRTLYISGFTDDAIVQHGVLQPGLAFLSKPFLPEGLLRKMREVLDGPADQAVA